jgi:hypothetical protein
MFRERTINETIKLNRRTVLFPRLENVHTIGIIDDSSTNIFTDDIKQFNSNVRVTYLFLRDEKRNDNQTSNIIFKSDLDFWGLPKKNNIVEFVNQNFDILINFSSIDNDAATYIYALSKASFKVSYKPNRKINDLIIDLQEDKRYMLVNELIRTLKNF